MATLLPTLLGLRLVRNGSYSRRFPESTGYAESLVYRKKCQRCRVNFSLLPNDIIPLHSYGSHLICDRLEAYANGISGRSQEFYVSRGLVPDGGDDHEQKAGRGTSWSDRLTDSPLQPSHHLFRQWRRKWAASAGRCLGGLLKACILIGGDLKSKLGLSLEKFSQCSPSVRSLLLSAGLIALLREESVLEAWPMTVLLLGHSPSHKSFRAAGRSPPQYGGHLKFNAE